MLLFDISLENYRFVIETRVEVSVQYVMGTS